MPHGSQFNLDIDKIKSESGKLLAKHRINVTCNACGVENSVVGADIAAERAVVCVACKQTLQLKDGDGSFKKFIAGQ